jgi:hypothetical protein
MSPIFAMNTPPIIKKTWIKPAVKVVSVKKDTYEKTTGELEKGNEPTRRGVGN